jgi:methionyl-tRNA formyltransferase
MNIVFFGSSNFSVPSLMALIKGGHNILCVVTQPDRQKGRGLPLTATAVKKAGQGSRLNIYEPQKINTAEAAEFLKGFGTDLFVVVSYGQILSKDILEIPKIFSINAHASLLPKYRGAAPINWALINGESSTGVTIMKMTEEMDAGPIILQKDTKIDEGEDFFTLEDKLSRVAAELLRDSLKSIENGSYKLKEQDEGSVSFAPKLKKKDGCIDWDRPAADIYNLIRGCISWPGAFTYYNNKLLKIYRAGVARLSDYPVAPRPGKIMQVSKAGIIVATGKDNLIIEELQIEGKRRMRAEEFISGHKISAGEVLSRK